MADRERTLQIYQELADSFEQQHNPSMRDLFLMLAADAALRAGHAVEAELLRQRLAALNPHHLLKPYASFSEAANHPDIQSYVEELRQKYPVEAAEDMLESVMPHDLDLGAEDVPATLPPTPRSRLRPPPGALDSDKPFGLRPEPGRPRSRRQRTKILRDPTANRGRGRAAQSLPCSPGRRGAKAAPAANPAAMTSAPVADTCRRRVPARTARRPERGRRKEVVCCRPSAPRLTRLGEDRRGIVERRDSGGHRANCSRHSPRADCQWPTESAPSRSTRSWPTASSSSTIPSMRDLFLMLAADAALRAGHAVEAELLRQAAAPQPTPPAQALRLLQRGRQPSRHPELRRGTATEVSRQGGRGHARVGMPHDLDLGRRGRAGHPAADAAVAPAAATEPSTATSHLGCGRSRKNARSRRQRTKIPP